MTHKQTHNTQFIQSKSTGYAYYAHCNKCKKRGKNAIANKLQHILSLFTHSALAFITHYFKQNDTFQSIIFVHSRSFTKLILLFNICCGVRIFILKIM